MVRSVANKISPFPSREAVLTFIRESPTPVGKREIARAFRLTGEHRVALRDLLKELSAEGFLERGRNRRVSLPNALPEFVLVEVLEVDHDGEVIAKPLNWDLPEPEPRIRMAPTRRGEPTLGKGDRLMAKVARISDRWYKGRAIRRIDRGESRIIGIYRTIPGGGRIDPTDRKAKGEYSVHPDLAGGAETGDLVVAELLPTGRLGLRAAKVVERVGRSDSPRVASLIAIHGRGLPVAFPNDALHEAAHPPKLTMEGREDLRSIPLVTIDGADARDFDDAVWAAVDHDPNNKGGWHILAAIADVAHYVRPHSALDRVAEERGNSAYFPDRVVPMLPEALSNELCSLKPAEDRPCLAVHMWIDRTGRLLRHRFVRGMMRSAARLTYEQLQAARDGQPDATTLPLLGDVIAPLYGAYATLADARAARGTLELDLPERMVKLTEAGEVAAIEPRPRLDSHRLIEEYMILANQAAALSLEDRRMALLYRVHDRPSPDKMDGLREFLGGLGYKLQRSKDVRPGDLSNILRRAAGTPNAQVISEIILRSQAQAVYSPENLGHFGLALARYAHFTSPIRRYADLIVHRALIRAHGLGSGGLSDDQLGRLEEIGEHISMTERRAIAAERDAHDRYTAAFLKGRIGAIFSGVVSGVAGAGLFVRLDESGADGLVPISALPDDYYDVDETRHALVGRRWGRLYQLGMAVKVRLAEADPISGSTIFALMDAEATAAHVGHEGRAPARGRGKPATKRGTYATRRGRR